MGPWGRAVAGMAQDWGQGKGVTGYPHAWQWGDVCEIKGLNVRIYLISNTVPPADRGCHRLTGHQRRGPSAFLPDARHGGSGSAARWACVTLPAAPGPERPETASDRPCQTSCRRLAGTDRPPADPPSDPGSPESSRFRRVSIRHRHVSPPAPRPRCSGPPREYPR